MRQHIVLLVWIVMLLAPAQARAQLPFDLVTTEFDINGIGLNPQWGWAVLSGVTTRGPTTSDCNPPYDAKCTSWGVSHNWVGCSYPGHANWTEVTYSGQLFWGDHSTLTDDDYNFTLRTPNHAGTTGNDSGILLEFDSDETIDHFHTPWWSKFHDAVDAFDQPNRPICGPGGCGLPYSIDGSEAIVIGLLGLDCAHSSCGSEIHPVWAMAIHVKDDPSDDVWAFFVRNWGNEGFCGWLDQHLPVNSLSFRLPWRKGATDVGFLNQPNNGDRLFLTNNAKNNWVYYGRDGDSVLVGFGLAGPDEHSRTNGELHMVWTVPTPAPPAPPRPAPGGCSSRPFPNRQHPAESSPLEKDDPESRFASLIRGLKPDQRTDFQRASSRPAPLPDGEVPRLLPSPPAIGSATGVGVRSVAYFGNESRMKRRIAALTAIYGRDVSPILSGQEALPNGWRNRAIAGIIALLALVLALAARAALRRRSR